MKYIAVSVLAICCFVACSSEQKKTAASRDSTSASKPIVSNSKDTSLPAFFTPKVLSEEEQGVTVPDYGLPKVMKMIAKIQSLQDTSDGDQFTEALVERDYSSLSLREKFTYHMIHPESYSQICDILPERTDEGNRIYGQLANSFGEYTWSDRQLNYFKDNRDSVEYLMKENIIKYNKVGSNFKEAIIEMNAKEMIPFLIATYKKTGLDHYILTVLMLLMRKNAYPEFMNSVSYKKLYSVDENEYSAYLVFNKANEDLIIQRATNFYDGFHQK
jgi:hypothetical protein